MHRNTFPMQIIRLMYLKHQQTNFTTIATTTTTKVETTTAELSQELGQKSVWTLTAELFCIFTGTVWTDVSEEEFTFCFVFVFFNTSCICQCKKILVRYDCWIGNVERQHLSGAFFS